MRCLRLLGIQQASTNVIEVLLTNVSCDSMVNPNEPGIVYTHLIVIVTHVRVKLIGTCCARTSNIVENHTTLVISHVENAPKTTMCCILFAVLFNIKFVLRRMT